MANDQMLTNTQLSLDMADTYDYEATAHGTVFGCGALAVHLIWYVGDPVNKFHGVPNGSMTIDGTNHHTYTKTGAAGSGKDGAWVVNA